jgi:DNA-binding response OmpR family regulator
VTTIHHFQKLQELLVVTPFTFHEVEETVLPSARSFEVLEKQANDEDAHAQWGSYHHYLHTFTTGIQGDEVIAVRLVHPASMEALQQVYCQTLPDAVLIDAPGYHLLEAVSHSSDDAFIERMSPLFHPDLEEVLSPLEMTRHIRQWSVHEGFRTVILNLSHGEVEEDRIQSLVQGADELLDTNMSSEELCIRVLSHIRRHLDQYQSPLTRQPNADLLERMFNRRIRQGLGVQVAPPAEQTSSASLTGALPDASTDALPHPNSQQHWALAVFYIDSLNTYGLLYGQEAKMKVVQHCAAVLAQMLHVPDWVFHIEENTFVVLSTPERLERILPIVTKRLDASCGHFLSPDDLARGFFIWKQDSLFTRVPSLRVGTGVLYTNVTPFNHLTPVISKGLQLALKALAQIPSHESATLSDRFLFSTPEEAQTMHVHAPPVPYVIVVEADAALAFLLEQTISMNGIDVDVMPSVSDALVAIQQRMPTAMVVDPYIETARKESHVEDENPWQGLLRLKEQAPHTVFLATCNHDDVEKALIHGAQAFLPKPYKLLPLLSWLDYVLKVKLG